MTEKFYRGFNWKWLSSVIARWLVNLIFFTDAFRCEHISIENIEKRCRALSKTASSQIPFWFQYKNFIANCRLMLQLWSWKKVQDFSTIAVQTFLENYNFLNEPRFLRHSCREAKKVENLNYQVKTLMFWINSLKLYFRRKFVCSAKITFKLVLGWDALQEIYFPLPWVNESSANDIARSANFNNWISSGSLVEQEILQIAILKWSKTQHLIKNIWIGISNDSDAVHHL